MKSRSDLVRVSPDALVHDLPAIHTVPYPPLECPPVPTWTPNSKTPDSTSTLVCSPPLPSLRSQPTTMPPKSAPSTPTKASRAKAAAPKPTARGPTGLTKAYLVAYNALSGLAWAYCLLRLGLHMRGVSDVGQAVKRAGSAYAE